MKTQVIIGLTVLGFLLPIFSRVQAEEVPHYVNFQSVLREDSGNIAADGFIDVQMKILDQAGSTVYEEAQPGVQVVRGAINIMIGEGIEPGSNPAKPTGGIPPAALDPAKGSHSLQIQFGSNQPSDPMELESVPYAVYAEQALSLAANFPASAVPDIFATDDEVAAAIAAHEAKNPAHPAANISVAGPITHGGGANVEKVVRDLDSSLTTEEGARAAGDSNEASARATGDTNLQSQINGKVSISGDTMTGTLNMGGNSVTNVGTSSGIGFTVADHENRITALEGEPNQLKVNAWVYVQDPDGSLGNKTYFGYGIASVQRVSGSIYTVGLSPSLLNANYCAVATAADDTNGNTKLYANVPAKSTSNVQVRVKEESGGQDYGNFSLMILGGLN